MLIHIYICPDYNKCVAVKFATLGQNGSRAWCKLATERASCLIVSYSWLYSMSALNPSTSSEKKYQYTEQVKDTSTDKLLFKSIVMKPATASGTSDNKWPTMEPDSGDTAFKHGSASQVTYLPSFLMGTDKLTQPRSFGDHVGVGSKSVSVFGATRRIIAYVFMHDMFSQMSRQRSLCPLSC